MNMLLVAQLSTVTNFDGRLAIFSYDTINAFIDGGVIEPSPHFFSGNLVETGVVYLPRSECRTDPVDMVQFVCNEIKRDAICGDLVAIRPADRCVVQHHNGVARVTAERVAH
jgi:hypothetical protein